MKQILLLWAILQVGALWAQDSQLAIKYFQEQDYAKAEVLYEKLYRQTGDKEYLGYQIKCLVGLRQWSKAEELLQRAQRKHKDVEYQIQYAALLKAQGKTDRAAAELQNVVDKLPPNHYEIVRTSNLLVAQNEYTVALDCLRRGAVLLGKPTLFQFDMARLYAMQRDYTNMIVQYLDLLKENPGYYNPVQNNLQYYLAYDIDNNLSELLRKELLRYTRQYPDVAGYSELLIWLYLQEAKYDAALVQVRALDLRQGSSGDQLVDFAQLALKNQAFGPAQKAFEAVLAYGERAEPTNRLLATDGLLEARFLRLTQVDVPDTAAMLALERDMLRQYANEPMTSYGLLQRLVDLQAFYLGKTAEAQAALQAYIDNPLAEVNDRARALMLLADVLLVAADPWQALLIYARVERDNKHNELGHEAKFRKTKVAYFTADFAWAKAQLDILKASTSKLIANDAFALSLLIKDNLTEADSASPALEAFADAQMLVVQKKHAQALAAFDTIARQYATQPVAEYALYDQARLLHQLHRTAPAIATLERLASNYSQGIWADDALFLLGQLYQLPPAQPQAAMDAYKRLMQQHRASVFVPEARKAFRALRGDAPKQAEPTLTDDQQP